tara:strand:- start:68990 stop:69940 length:951 start_codon:yes stop_codon:yes gene_type:complete
MNAAHAKNNDWLTRTPKWVLLAAFWTAQAIVLYLVQAFLYTSQSILDTTDINGDQTDTLIPKGILGEWPALDEVLSLLINPEYLMVASGGILALTIAQMIFMLPCRQPGLASAHGRSVRKSLFIAGGTIGVLVFALVMGVYGFSEDALDRSLPMWDLANDHPYFTAGILISISWLVATPLLIKFAKPGPKETVLARLSKKLFIGTIIEIALLIPLDYMVRRKTDCYCWAGTYWALTVCGFVGVLALGPAVFLPILAKRRKTWYGGHCGVCGYDMGGSLDAPRCPECGTGWKSSPEQPLRAPKPSKITDSESESTNP